MYQFKNIFLFVFFSSSILFSLSCKGQHSSNAEIEETVHEKFRTKYNPKDLKILSEFIDTTKLFNYQDQIAYFNIDDSLHPNRKIDIVFSGSSSIRKWQSLKEDFKGYSTLNRGFGGSTVPEAIYYSDVLFLKHKPKKIVFYSGDNDIAFFRSSTDKIIKSYKYLFDILSSELPNTQIYILSIKPSPARWRFWPQMQEINNKLKLLCNTYKFEYIDVSDCLLSPSGKPIKKLFAKDGVHMNKSGYALWADIINEAIE